MRNADVAYGAGCLPHGIRSIFVDNGNGLVQHVLEAGHEDPSRPAILLLHGFPELAFSWRRQLLPLAAAGYRVLAPDQRGYGQTTGWDSRYDGDVASFGFTNLVRDATGLLDALGIDAVTAVIGHDFGAPVAGWCALLRPDLFRSVVLMSAPFTGPPPVAAGTTTRPDMDAALAALPRPRRHYMQYYGTRPAADAMLNPPQGLHDFMRAYYHVKSADYPANAPAPLPGWSAEALARLPAYYVMDSDRDMPATVAPDMPTADQVAACQWLPDSELAVYVAEYARTGFQGGLNWYRCAIDPALTAELSAHAGLTIDIPATFIAGARDWGVYQTPGALERMARQTCTDYRGTALLEGAGHWVQQEQAERTTDLLRQFLVRVGGRT